MKDYDPSTKLSCLVYWDVNNLCGLAMSQKLPVDSFEWKKKKSKFTQKFIRNYDEDNDKDYVLEVDVSYPKRLQKM